MSILINILIFCSGDAVYIVNYTKKKTEYHTVNCTFIMEYLFTTHETERVDNGREG